jgi:hypothetical protein
VVGVQNLIKAQNRKHQIPNKIQIKNWKIAFQKLEKFSKDEIMILI